MYILLSITDVMAFIFTTILIFIIVGLMDVVIVGLQSHKVTTWTNQLSLAKTSLCKCILRG